MFLSTFLMHMENFTFHPKEVRIGLQILTADVQKYLKDYFEHRNMLSAASA